MSLTDSGASGVDTEEKQQGNAGGAVDRVDEKQITVEVGDSDAVVIPDGGFGAWTTLLGAYVEYLLLNS